MASRGSRAVASLANATPRQGSCGAGDHAPKIGEVAAAARVSEGKLNKLQLLIISYSYILYSNYSY